VDTLLIQESLDLVAIQVIVDTLVTVATQEQDPLDSQVIQE